MLDYFDKKKRTQLDKSINKKIEKAEKEKLK